VIQWVALTLPLEDRGCLQLLLLLLLLAPSPTLIAACSLQ
jgi:hypothetical protein